MTQGKEVAERLVDTDHEPPRFVGSACTTCGALSFPARRRCGRCHGTEFTAELVAPVGELYSYTVVHLGRPGMATPYVIGVVDFPDSIRVLARVLDWVDRDGKPKIVIGESVTAAVAPADEQTGNPVADYRLRLVPAATAGGGGQS
jgi:uncharacterized OB-fold protein